MALGLALLVLGIAETGALARTELPEPRTAAEQKDLREELAAKAVRFVNEEFLSDSAVRFDVLDPEDNVVQISEE